MQHEKAEALLKKYQEGKATQEEITLLLTWIQGFNANETKDFSAEELESVKVEMWESQLPVKKAKLWPMAATAAAIVMVVLGLYFFRTPNKDSFKAASQPINEVTPGKIGATLTLANGQKIRLGDAISGKLAEQNGVVISKTEDGQLVYILSGKLAATSQINTISTTNGETYTLILPDSSKVWINAASSLTYAATLNEQGKRVVKLNGEAYFEVAKDKEHPFVVQSNGQQIEVLGTHFNVSAYPDDHTATTLLEGSVKINAVTIKPNEQASQINGEIIVRKVNAKLAVDWINGKFVCTDVPLESFMKKVSRWYNVTVVYENADLMNKTVSGSLSRYADVKDLLKALKYAGVSSKLEQREIHIIK